MCLSFVEQFDNVLVRREYNTKGVILATLKAGCKAFKTALFKENVIQPSELPKSFTNTTTPAEILGVQSFAAYHAWHVPMQKKRSLWKNPQLLLVIHVT